MGVGNLNGIVISSLGSRGGDWTKSGREKRKRQRRGWSRSCSEVAPRGDCVSLGWGVGASGTSAPSWSVDGQTVAQVLELVVRGQRASGSPLCPSRHSEVRRGRPAAPRADCQAQDECEQGPGEQGRGASLSGTVSVVLTGLSSSPAGLSLSVCRTLSLAFSPARSP